MRQSRLLQSFLSFGFIAGFAVLVWAAILQPAAAWKTRQFDQRQASATKVATLKGSLARLAAEEASLGTDTDNASLWPAGQLGEATARVQSAISASATQNAVDLHSITPTQGTALAIARTVSFRLEAEASLDAFSAFLLDLEFHTPALLVESADLRLLSRPTGQGAQPLIFVQMEIIAPVRLNNTSGEVSQ